MSGFKTAWEAAFLAVFFIVAGAVALSTSLNHLDSNLHLDYVREIQNVRSVPRYHPRVFNTAGVQIPFPYPVGYHLAMAIFPHRVTLYKLLQVLFAVSCLILILKLAGLLGVKRRFYALIPFVLTSPFSRFSITPHPDLLALLFSLLSAYFMLRYLQGGGKIHAAAAVLAGFYGGLVREFALITLLFFSLALSLKYRGKLHQIGACLISILLLTLLGYYWMNCLIKGQNLLYPFFGREDPKASDWYLSHVSFWSILRYAPAQALGELLGVFSLFLPMFLLVKPRDTILASVFGCQIVLTFLFLPSTGGLDRYVMFALPFMAIAYANVWERLPKGVPVVLLLAGMFALYPLQGYALEKKLPKDFEEIAENLGPGDHVLFREYGQLAYRTGCRANWTSLFWSSDLFESFERVDKVEDLIRKHGVTHVLIDKELILRAGSPMIGNEAMGYPMEWVKKVENMGVKMGETSRYLLYRVGGP